MRSAALNLGLLFCRVACTLVVSVFLLSCTQTLRINDGLISRLQNRGPVALSSDNPYLAANLLLAREMEQSVELRGFVEHRGAPNALEVEKPRFGHLQMHLYYPESREFYSVEEVQKIWIIRGPLTIPREKMKSVSTITRNVAGEPSLTVRNISPGPFESYSEKARDFFGEPKQAEALVAKEIYARERASMEHNQTSNLTFRHNRPEESLEAREQTLTHTIELLREQSPHPAEITPKGDLVHYVTYAGETLSMIARWFTDERANVGRLARINKLQNPNELSIGDEVIIPSYLVKNKSRLTEEAVKRLAVLSQP